MDSISGLQWYRDGATGRHPVPVLNMALLALTLTIAHVNSWPQRCGQELFTKCENPHEGLIHYAGDNSASRAIGFTRLGVRAPVFSGGL